MDSQVKHGELVHCPRCNAMQASFVQEYVVQGTIGEASLGVHDCFECDAQFTVVHQGAGAYRVEYYR